MAFDGIVIANLVRDLNEKIASGRISKIAQPEKDELLFTIKGNRENVRLLISAERQSPTPLFYIKQQTEPDDGSELLHAFKKAYRKRQDHLRDPAGTGADRPDRGRASR